MALPAKNQDDEIKPARDCGGCTLCCKVMAVKALDKPGGTWCAHCSFSQGCTIHETKPDECRDFYCGYLMMPNLDERWKPSVSKLIVVAAPEEAKMTIYVDASRPNAWREEPFHSRLRLWARHAMAEDAKVIVALGRRAIVILPDDDVDLGIVAEDERIVTSRTRTPLGVKYEAMKLHKDDPRAAMATSLDGLPTRAEV